MHKASTMGTGRQQAVWYGPRWSLLLVLVLCASALTIAGPAQAYACGTLFNYRGVDQARGIGNAKAVQGVLHVPRQGEVTGVASGHGASAADVFLINGSDFVQAGYYLGYNDSGLTNVTTPHFWWGEYHNGAHGSLDENTHTMGSLAWGSVHTVKVSFDSTPGVYDIYLDGVYKATSQYTHFTQGVPAFNGEIDFKCIRMEALATAAPNKSLKYATFGSSGTVWTWFTDQRSVIKPANSTFTLVSTSAGTSASDYSYGGGS